MHMNARPPLDVEPKNGESAPPNSRHRVSKGVTKIGEVGDTGASTAPHLHLGAMTISYGNKEENTINTFFFFPDIPLGGYTVTY